METVAVVGGTGFLGRHVVRALGDSGRQVRVLSRRTGFDGLRPPPESLRGCQALVNLAGIKREAGRQTFQAIHVDLVSRLVEAMKEAGLRRLVHVSVVVARRTPHQPYLDTKAQGEELVRESGLDWTILRPGVIYGEGDDLLTHLVLMIRASRLFPIVGRGQAPMRPIGAPDVAAGIAAALGRPESSRRTYELVGPEALSLRGVVERVAQAEGLPVTICPTPVRLLYLPVWLMEAWAREPLSTRAQLAMLTEGLSGDPEPARRDLEVVPAPFTPERLRPLTQKVSRRASIDLRLFSAPRPPREASLGGALGLAALAFALITAALRGPWDRWEGMTLAMGLAGAASLAFGAVRRRFRPTSFRVAFGLLAGGALAAVSLMGARFLGWICPGWEIHARALYEWRGDHSWVFVAPTLAMIVLAEELVWRGVVGRALMERFGRVTGIVAGALIYSAAHAAAGNPVLLGAALGLGMVWGWLAAATDDLTAPFFCHLVWDVIILFVFPVAS